MVARKVSDGVEVEIQPAISMDEKGRTTNGLRGGASERESSRSWESVFIRVIRGVH